MQISIVYDSGHGHTQKLAEAVAAGVHRISGAQAQVFAVADGAVSWEALEASDAIIFGAPTYNSSLSARFKQFMEASTRPAWLGMKWRDKVAAGFTNSGAQNGDKLNALTGMALFAAQHGMVWVGLDLMPGQDSSKTSPDLNRLGSWLGAMAQSDDASAEITPPDSDLRTAAYLGERVANTVRRLQAQTA
jgi:multimeric flavodoxin WrbA